MDRVGALKAAGNTAFVQTKYSEAEELYTQALDVCEKELCTDGVHVLYSNRSAARLKTGNEQGALQDANAALAIKPRWAKGHFRKASALKALGRDQQAEEALRAVLDVEPNSTEAAAMLRSLEQARSPADGPPGQSPGQSPGSIPLQGRDPAELHKLRSSPPPDAAFPPQLRSERLFQPPADGLAENLLTLLHGLGDAPRPFDGLARSMALPQTASLALAGPLAVPFTENSRAWFRAFDDDFELIQGRPGERRRIESLEATLALVEAALRGLRDRCGWDLRRIHLFGYSQGGTVALALAQKLRGDERLGSCVSVSGSLLEETLAGVAPAGDSGAPGGGAPAAPPPGRGTPGGTPVLMTHGDADSVVPRAAVLQSITALREAGCPVKFVSIKGKPHGMVSGEAEMRELMAFWAGTLSRRPTAADAAPPGMGAGGVHGSSVQAAESTIVEITEGAEHIDIPQSVLNA